MVTTLPEALVVADGPPDSARPPESPLLAGTAGTGEWSLLLVPVLVSVAMIIVMAVIGT